MGISLALVIAFITIPAGMVLLGKGSHTSLKDNSSAFTAKFAWLTEHYGTLILLTALSLAALSAYGISKLEVEKILIPLLVNFCNKQSLKLYVLARRASKIEEKFYQSINKKIIFFN